MTTKDKIEAGLTSPNLETRKYFAENIDVLLSDFQINRGLTDRHPLIRYIFAKKYLNNRNFEFTEALCKRGMNDENERVRALFAINKSHIVKVKTDLFLKDKSTEVKIALAKNPLLDFTEKQLKKMLSSKIKRVRSAFTNEIKTFSTKGTNTLFKDFSITDSENFHIYFDHACRNPRQLETLLLSQFESVRKAAYTKCTIYNETLSYRQKERGLLETNKKIKKYLAFSDSYLTEKQIEDGLKDPDESVRESFVAKESIKLTKRQTEAILDDCSYKVVYALLNRLDAQPTKDQIEDGLTSKHANVRRAFANSMNLILTDRQIRRGLFDKDDSVCAAFISRGVFEKHIDSKIADKLLGHPSPEVKLAILSKKDIILTKKQVGKGLKDEDPRIRKLLANRHDVTLTALQIEAGLTDGDEGVRCAFMERLDFMPTQEQIGRALIDASADVRASAASCGDISFTPEQIEIILNDCSLTVRISFVTRNDIQLTDEQILTISKDPNPEVRRSMVENNNIKLTDKQIQTFLKDSNPMVRYDTRVRVRKENLFLIKERERVSHISK